MYTGVMWKIFQISVIFAFMALDIKYQYAGHALAAGLIGACVAGMLTQLLTKLFSRENRVAACQKQSEGAFILSGEILPPAANDRIR